VLVAGSIVPARERIDQGNIKARQIGEKDVFVVPGKNAVVEAVRTEFAVQKTEPKQMVAELVTEESLAADALERYPHAGLRPWLGRDAGTGKLVVELVKPRRAFPEHGVERAPDGPQAMIDRHDGVVVQHGREVRLGLRCTTYVLSEAAQLVGLNFHRFF
jgi:hypothetical protein